MPKRIGLLLSDWPAADQHAWERANASVDYFDDQARAVRWSPKTCYQAQGAYARWLAFMLAQYPAALSEAPGKRVTEARARRYIEVLRGRVTPMSVAAELQHLLLAVRVMAPGDDWRWLGTWQNRWQRGARPREKRAKIVHPIRLIELGRTLMDGAEEERRPILNARSYRDGLLIAFLAARPLRRRSVSALQLDRHVQKVGATYVVHVRGADMKSGQPIDFDLPGWLTPYFTKYVEQFRPLFPRAARERAVWLSSDGGALTGDAIYRIVCRRTQAAFGFAINPHLFRDIAATGIASDAPEHIGIARDLLAHACVETTQRHYTQAQTADAARTYSKTLEALRAARTIRRG